MSSSARRARLVAVVSDGSAFTGHPATLESALGHAATLINDLAGVHTRAVLLDPVPDTAGLARQLASLSRGPSDIAAVALTHTEPARARQAQAAQSIAAGPPVVIDQDTTAIALAAAVLTTLTRAGRTPATSRVVIAGAEAMPALCGLLVAVGIGDITTWNTDDAVAFPLLSVAAGSDVVINLLGSRTGEPALPALCATHTGPVVITPDPARDPLFVLPGLLRALIQVPGARVDSAGYHDVRHACVLALVMATPPEQQRPHGPDRDLTDRVADAATRALQPTARHRAVRRVADRHHADPHQADQHRHDAPRGDTE